MHPVTTRLSEDPLDVAAAIAAVKGPASGGIGTFVGTVRESPAVDANAGRSVVRLDYEAHPELASKKLDEIAREALGRWDLSAVLAIHRTGRCEVGEPTVVVCCAAPHRGAALDATRWVIDTIKTTVPIWKREVYADGTAWVGAEGATG